MRLIGLTTRWRCDQSSCDGEPVRALPGLQERRMLEVVGNIFVMATGRGWILQQHNEHKHDPKRRPRPASSKSSEAQAWERQPIHNNALKGVSTKVNSVRNRYGKNLNIFTKLCSNHTSYIEKIPVAILLKMFSYLDPVSLMSAGCVSKQFYELSNDNVLWYKVYSLHMKKNMRWKSDSINSAGKRLHFTTIADKEPGYWKKTYISELITGTEKRMNQILKCAKKYNAFGAPANMEKAVKMSGLIWALTFKDINGKETIIEQSDITFRDTSLTIYWNSYIWPGFQRLITLQLHGVTQIQTDCLRTPKNGLQRHSLIAEYNLKDFKRSSRFIGHDSLIKLFYLDPGLIVGLWKTTPDIAFVKVTLHYHQLLEKSFWGTAKSPYLFPPHVPVLDDIDPEYGLHGYQLHIDMYSGPKTYFCTTFRGLSSRKDYIRNGNVRITAIGFKNNRQHAPLVGKVDFMWETITFSGSIQNCFMMDVTVLDDLEAPYWCFCAPVQLQESKHSETLYDFMGQSFYLEYKDSVGKLHAELNWMNETEEYVIINLVLLLNTEKDSLT
ncbi:F-box only protein 15 isoform X2 [Rana temporaria]|uniref:F-box only protein 15 isoform X2 n=1 Tax=Rana temporaria TaxID=8407 RepID=UPI001AAD7D2F|nr:F-box only protein 15 isoform X2 [Rana temporaria]